VPFLKLIPVKGRERAIHFDSIKSDGLGYHLRIKNFDRLLEVLKVDETEMFTEMKRLIDNVSSPQYRDELLNFLSVKSRVGKPKMNKIFSALNEKEKYRINLYVRIFPNTK
jgi:hypothetical protein